MLVWSIVLSFLLILNYGGCLPRVDPLVDTNVGLIRGLRADDGDYAMFLGIPYAQVDPENPFGVSSCNYFCLLPYNFEKLTLTRTFSCKVGELTDI